MRRRIRVVEIAEVFEAIRRRSDLPDPFPPDVLGEAERARPVGGSREDLRDIPFVTIDPPDALDLDQAIHLEPRAGGGIRLRYAIADVPAFVTPVAPSTRKPADAGPPSIAPTAASLSTRRCCRKAGPASSPAKTGPPSSSTSTSTPRAMSNGSTS